MDAEWLMLETDAAGNLRHVPKLPPNKQLEAIFLVVGTTRNLLLSVALLILILQER